MFMMLCQVILWIHLIIPYCISPDISFYLTFGIVFVFVLVEIIAICVYRKQVNLPAFNLYFLSVSILGYLNKTMLLTLAYFSGIYFR
jgi:hypothetical protein